MCLQTEKLFEVMKASGGEKRHNMVSIRAAVVWIQNHRYKVMEGEVEKERKRLRE